MNKMIKKSNQESKTKPNVQKPKALNKIWLTYTKVFELNFMIYWSEIDKKAIKLRNYDC